jgi:hypothetical protein
MANASDFIKAQKDREKVTLKASQMIERLTSEKE